MSPPDALTAEVMRAPEGPQIGAFFDFDGTVIDGYSASAFYRHRLRHGQIGPEELGRTLLVGLRGDLDGDRFAELMRIAALAWRDRSVNELDELGERLFRERLAGSIYPEAWALVQAHHRRGHTVVLASSATRFQAGPAARELEVDHLLCTGLESDGGVLTGRIEGPSMWGRGKAEAIRRLAAEEDVDLDASFAYSNGFEDLPFLEAVGRPRPLNPDGRLADEAARRGWPARRFRGRGRPGPVDVGRTVAAYGGMFASFGVGLGIGLVNRSRRQAVDLSFSLFGDVTCALAGVELDVQGEAHIWSHRPCVFLINHQSAMDVPVMAKLLRRDYTGVVKKEAERSTVGPMFRLAGVAFVDRADTAQAKEQLSSATEKLREGISLAVAPEGHRSSTPRLGPFKKGAFHVAMQAGVPVVPVVLRNTGEAQASGGVIMRPARVDIFVHPPVDTADWTVRALDKRVAEVRDLYVDTLANWPSRVAGRLNRGATT